MNNNDTSLNEGNNNLQNQNGANPNAVEGVNPAFNDNLQGTSLGNLESVPAEGPIAQSATTNNAIMDFSLNQDSMNSNTLDSKDVNSNNNGMMDVSSNENTSQLELNFNASNLSESSPQSITNSNVTNENMEENGSTINETNQNMNTISGVNENVVENTAFDNLQNPNPTESSNSISDTNLNTNPIINNGLNSQNTPTDSNVNPILNGNIENPANPTNVTQSVENTTSQMNFGTNSIGSNPFMENSNTNLAGGFNAQNLNNLDSNNNANGAVGTNNIIQTVPTPPNMMDFNALNDDKKNKKKMSKTTIFIIAILLICVIGVGIYFVLNTAKNKKTNGSITLKENLEMELGQALSTNVSDYATIQGFDLSTCKVDTSNVEVSKMGSYDYNVTCGTTSRSGKVYIKDMSAPVVVVKELNVIPGTKVTLEDFIVSCTDVSNCSYELEDPSINLDTLTASEGSNTLNLIVSDDFDNQAVVELKLNVTQNAPVKYMYCSPSSSIDDELNATLDITYYYGINNEDELVSSQKITTYTFSTEEDYRLAKENYSTPVENQTVNFDDNDFIITVTRVIEDLAAEFNVSSFPTEYADLKPFHNDLQITCKNR